MIGQFPFGSTALGGATNTSVASAQWSQSGKASIKKAATRTQTGIGRVKVHTQKTQSGLAKIRKATARTQTGLARIRKARTITGVASIRIAGTQQTISGAAYIKSMRSARIILIMTQSTKHIE